MSQLVSVIIPCYNAERWIGEAVQSCLNQTYPPVEVVVADDGSTDGSVAVVEKMAAGTSAEIKVLRLPHKGGCAARNAGFRHSRGDYIQWLDADDLLEPEKIADQASVAKANREAIIYGPWFHLIETEKGKRTGPRNGLAPVTDSLAAHLAGFLAPCHAFLTPRFAVERFGGWDETLSSDQDGDLFMRFMIQNIPFFHAAGGAAIWRHHFVSHRVSQQRSLESFESRFKVCTRVAEVLRAQDRLKPYAELLAKRFDGLAQLAASDNPDFAQLCLESAHQVCPSYRPPGGNGYVWLRTLAGFRISQRLRRWSRHLMRRQTDAVPQWLTASRP